MEYIYIIAKKKTLETYNGAWYMTEFEAQKDIDRSEQKDNLTVMTLTCSRSPS